MFEIILFPLFFYTCPDATNIAMNEEKMPKK